MEQRLRDAGRGVKKVCEHVVRDCNTMAEEASWSGRNQVREQAWEDQRRRLENNNKKKIQEGRVGGAPRFRE